MQAEAEPTLLRVQPQLPARFFAALGMGIGSLVAGAALLVASYEVELANVCVNCMPGPIFVINGTLLYLGILLTMFGLGFSFVTLLSPGKRWA